VNPHLEFLLSRVFDDDRLHPEHLSDLRNSGLTDATITLQKIRSVPPHMIDLILGFPAPKVMSAYVIPFADPAGKWTPHVRMRIFPAYRDMNGRLVKYLGPRGGTPRLFFALATIGAALHGHEPLWLVEGAKKALAVAQLGLPAVGFEGIEGWHTAGSRDLLPDFSLVAMDRVVELVPDGDVKTKDAVRRGTERLAAALARVGARPRLVALPAEVAA